VKDKVNYLPFKLEKLFQALVLHHNPTAFDHPSISGAVKAAKQFARSVHHTILSPSFDT
jgi:hypothetical protein